MVMKMLLATAELNDAYSGGMSSYGLLLLVATFLQSQPLELRLPSLERVPLLAAVETPEDADSHAARRRGDIATPAARHLGAHQLVRSSLAVLFVRLLRFVSKQIRPYITVLWPGRGIILPRSGDPPTSQASRSILSKRSAKGVAEGAEETASSDETPGEGTR